MDEDQKEFVALLFNLGKLSGSMMQPHIADKLVRSMRDIHDGPRLMSHMTYLHKQLGKLINQAEGRQDGHEPDGQ